MTTNYGSDFLCMSDLDEALRFVSGPALAMQNVFHRLTTPALVDDDDFGIDVRAFIGRGYTAATIAEIQPTIEEVAQRDDRVKSCVCTARLESGADVNEVQIILELKVETEEGPFRLVLKVTTDNIPEVLEAFA